MHYNFDEIIPRRNSDSVKWNLYDENIIPFWVADMDFRSPQPVIDALQARIAHGVFGYPAEDVKLKETIGKHLYDSYQWKVSADEIIFLPGVVNGFNLVTHAVTEPGQKVLMQTPVYHPFLAAPQYAKAIRQEAPLILGTDQKYTIDFDAFGKSFDNGTKMFLLCNPHNPVGRVFTKEELSRMAEISLSNNAIICSDEIHCDLVFNGNKHIPIATLNPEIASSTITLMAPSKTYNIAGLGCSFAVIQNPSLRNKVTMATQGLVPHVNLLGYAATKAAYQFGEEWLTQLLAYLEENYRIMEKFIKEELPEIKLTPLEGTYLAWMDCRSLELDESPYDFFLKNASIALTDGQIFGTGGSGFVRVNFGCPRSVLLEGLDRMKKAVEIIR